MPVPVFTTLQEVQAWADANGGEQAVRELLAKRNSRLKAFDWDTPRMAETWLQEQERREAGARVAAEYDLARRATVAAEQSAEAARQSARWARWAVVIAVIAIVVSAWPYFSKLFE